MKIFDMEFDEPVNRHIELERAAKAQFIYLGQNGTRPIRNKTLSSGNSSNSKQDTVYIFALCSDNKLKKLKFFVLFVCSLEKATAALFSGTYSTLLMMSPLAHAGSDEAYARVLVVARVLDVTSIDLEVALYHDRTYTRQPISSHPVRLAISNNPVGAGGAPRSLEPVVLSGSQIYRASVPRTENRKSARRPLADQTHGFHGEDDRTEGCTAADTDRQK